ncbi:uncharacterized protein A1O9_10309 [Exophiala aquamarina CBS 119918]|uniref:3-oxoacyl-[acyl-carrier protein] reductase n=1 Tax=Exophiala aquamarina CBS 119918 TaxID=1182545 RepID=A0A072P2I0_9EURO|nr:uncharacterized protein A1O9_10309 [Exophiala aquamarina CBS 119918]KEF53907.1 hypothetical protein A1O9_10309 [Exophiala aquamarina CBS 119918]
MNSHSNSNANVSMVKELPGVAVVTGAASGIGRAVAHALARAGCSAIALIDVNAAGLTEVASSIRALNQDMRVLELQCDAAHEAEVVRAFDAIHDAFNRLDYAINCAGVPGNTGPSDVALVSAFDRVIAVNLRGLFLCARQELRIMKSQSLDSHVYPGIDASRAQRGAIVNIASGLAYVALPGCPAYCASKAGVAALTRSDAVDYALSRIRVNAVLPGIVETSMTSGAKAELDDHAVKVMTPLQRWGQPREIADACVFLCSSKASFVTGISMPVDGGYLAI